MEIELNESLRRRRDELRNKIDSLGANSEGDSSSAEDLTVKERELRALNTNIGNLTNRVRGGS